MGDESEYDDVLNLERAVNERYIRVLEAWYKGLEDLPSGVVVPRSSIWAGGAPKLQPSQRVIGPLVGRVALDYHDELLGSDYYIGTWYQELGDVVVISWAAPSARLFFEGRVSDWHDPDPGSLEARRGFNPRGHDIVGFSDDVERGVDRSSVFSGRDRPLQIPEPPSPPVPAELEPGEAPETEVEVIATPSSTPPLSAPPTASADDEGVGGESTAGRGDEVLEEVAEMVGSGVLRAERLVRESLERPRTGHLHSVLATLQADQFRVVTWPADQHLVVQGHPGTGKTIVATHRAAYLTHPERPERVGRVGLVGPTDEWVVHVRDVLDELGADRVEVISMETLVRDLAGNSRSPVHLDRERWFHVDWKTARLAKRATDRLRAGLSGSARKRVDLVLNKLTQCSEIRRELIGDPQISDWLIAARNAEGIRADASFLLFLANVGLAVEPFTDALRYDHLIVDEAQDVRPAEWAILTKMLRKGGRYSMFGDVNQRRTDFTWPSWEELAEQLEIGPSDGSPFVPEELEQGYRSTRQILRFASGLLARGDRRPSALREGPEPLVRRVGKNQLVSAVYDEAADLADRHPEGITAVITANPGEYEGMFLKEGWRRSVNRYILKNEGGHRVGVFKPVSARGLEFDGVVVVEPSEFPAVLGRHGRLYTALTRANKELTVVNVSALPKGLRGRGERKK
ncbi:MAG: hypothetical protein CL471_01565 [Acidobacteria bacterium]|jgi:hypothetical protein|nr:hypothetical protein [Acidobacteriota bacterium]MDP6422565.1 AAA family ATPase [SAR202 cluster bacterium]MQG58605.1 hypothetical protein [SAR202 cluster bacterium]|tara:strand:- start:2869 stop:4926 length:2058 start_codon:yes stop_codon:yes gene_type:complete